MPRRKAQPDPVPSALDRLDPAPAEQRQPEPPAPPRPPRHQPGQVEKAVLADLKLLPDELRKGGIAAAALKLAAELDAGLVAGRDAAGHAREIRQSLTTLRELAPGERKGDKTDEVAARREGRMSAGSGAG